MRKIKIISVIVFTILLAQLLNYTINSSKADEGNIDFVGIETGINFRLGERITESSILTRNLNCQEPYGISIGKDNITIDGNGYTINFIGEVADSEGIHNEGYNNVTVKNLTLTNFCFGIYLKNAEFGTIINNKISYTFGSGIWLKESSRNNVKQNTIAYGDNGHGILVSSGSKYNYIENNIITTTNGRGLSIEQSNNNSIYYNSMCGNRLGDLIIQESIGTIGDYNTATKVLAKNYQDKSNGDPCTYSCQSDCLDLEDSENDMIRNSLIVTSDYIFTEDIYSATGHGIVIGSNNIVLDGKGYVLDGISACPCDGAGVQRSGIFNPGFDNVTIKNLEIRNFCNGIYLLGDMLNGDYVFENIIDNCKIHNNGCDKGLDTSTHGVKLEYVRASRITNSSIYDNTGKGDGCEAGGNGIFLYASENNYIYNNLVSGNTKGGVFSKMKSSFNRISFNAISNNGQGGIIFRCKLSRFSVCDNNNIEGNKGPGIYVGGPQNTISYNTISNNQDGSIYTNDASIPDGIRISRDAEYTTLLSNIVLGHKSDIWVKEELAGIYGSNNSFNSSENYEESWGMKLEMTSTQVDSNSGLPTLTPTPLIATVLVFMTVFIVIGGYIRNSKDSNITFKDRILNRNKK